MTGDPQRFSDLYNPAAQTLGQRGSEKDGGSVREQHAVSKSASPGQHVSHGAVHRLSRKLRDPGLHFRTMLPPVFSVLTRVLTLCGWIVRSMVPPSVLVGLNQYLSVRA